LREKRECQNAKPKKRGRKEWKVGTARDFPLNEQRKLAGDHLGDVEVAEKCDWRELQIAAASDEEICIEIEIRSKAAYLQLPSMENIPFMSVIQA
jgi:hypothetical protein